MKTEDIDRKIGMPDVDEEWAKFEREVIGEETKPKKRVLVGWTVGIAASIALLAGFFIWGNDAETQADGGGELAQTTKVQMPEEINATNNKATQENTPNNSEDNPSTHLLAQTIIQPSDKVEEQTPATDNGTVGEEVFAVVEQQPYFKGGEIGLKEFIKQHLRYPSTAQAYGVSGKVLMNFKIDSLGFVSGAKAIKHFLKYDTLLLSRESETRQTQLKEQIAQQLEEECARVISLMPRWAPGKICGKVVSCKYNLPFLFQPSEFLANASDSASQGRSTELKTVSNSSNTGQNKRRVTGWFSRPTNDSVLILVNGKPLPNTVTKQMLQGNIFQYIHQRQQLVDSIMVYKDDQAKQRYLAKYGERVKYGVIEITTSPDTLCDAYVRQHPELKKSRRCVTGYVVNDATNEPLPFAQIYLPRWGAFCAMADSTGHFVFWPPLSVETIEVSSLGYKTQKIHVADSVLTVRLSRLRTRATTFP